MFRVLNVRGRRAWRPLGVIGLAASLAACDQSPLMPRILPPPQPNGSFTATIDGAAWSAKGRIGVDRSEESLGLIALSRTYAISISIGEAAEPGIYQIGDDSSVVRVSVHQIGAPAGAANFLGGAGSVVITALTDSHISGTFSFVGVPAPADGAGPLRVTSGAFDLSY
ncbi:MAG: DUF6252 family protein [Gemmatimonadales bacterium]